MREPEARQAVALPMVRVAASLVVLACVIGTLLPAAHAESLPETGTFTGVYHRDRWGRAQVHWFVVPPALQARFAPFEGKRIRFHVTKGIQEVNPGPVRMEAVSTIEAFDAGPALTLSMRRGPVAQPDLWFVRVRNAGDAPATIHLGDLHVRWHHRMADRPGGPAFPRAHGLEPAWGRHHPERPGAVILEAGAHVDVPFRKAVTDPLSEFAVHYLHRTDTGIVQPSYQAWARCDEPFERSAPGAALALRDVRVAAEPGVADGTHADRDGSYVLTARLHADDPKARVLAWNTKSGMQGPVVRIQARDAAGVVIPVRETVYLRDATGRWHPRPRRPTATLASLPRKGVPIRIRFERASRFHDEPIASVHVEVGMPDGLAALATPGAFEDSLRVEPPAFGAPLGGVRLRARAVMEAGGRRVRFHMQAINDIGAPRLLTHPGTPTMHGRTSGGRVQVLVDGKPLDGLQRTGAAGWAAKHTVGTPAAWSTPAVEVATLGRGDHTLQVVITCVGGTYENTMGRAIPVLEGTLRSAPTGFRIP